LLWWEPRFPNDLLICFCDWHPPTVKISLKGVKPHQEVINLCINPIAIIVLTGTTKL
jgi:hypothetical protein